MPKSIAEKVSFIGQIKDEVHELHPIIRNLLPNLPHVRSCEYTHGPNEYGADFVIAKDDPTLGTITYIGLIIKRGTITLSNYQATSRQISELKIERKFNGGKTDIHVGEIWVISNEKITKPAQDRINNEHKTSKVQFISGEKLTELLNKHFPEYWNQRSAALAGYLKTLQVKIEEKDLKFSLLGENSSIIFFEPDIRECEKDEYKPNGKKNKKNTYINIYDKIRKRKILFVEGDPGVGKSKLLRHIASKLIDECNANSPTVPVFFTFTDFVERYDRDLVELLKVSLSDSYEELWNNKNAKFLFIADSLDECKKENNHIEILDSFFEVIRSESRFSCIATSRHIDRYLLEENSLRDVFCAEIAPMSAAKVVQFLKEITKEISIPARIIEDVKKSKLFNELPRSPIAAILLAKILKEDARDLPSTLPELYSQYIEICVGRWEIERSLENQKEYRALNSILQNIAKYLMENAVNHLNVEEAKDFYREHLNNRGFGIDVDEFFDRTTSRCPIICIINGNKTFAFKHRSFVEFYFAKNIISSGGMGDLNDFALKSYWSHSLYFYVGLLEDPDSALNKFIDLPPSNDIEAFYKYNSMADLLLAGYAAKTETLIKGLSSASMTAAYFYINSIRNPKESSLKNFPQLHLLWLTQFTFKSAFNYDFLKQHIDAAALLILDESDDEDAQAVALFLLEVTLQIGKKETEFKLLTDVSKSLPLAVKLGVGHESEGRKKSKFVKKLDKHLKERYRSDPKFKSEICKLYETSIEKFVLL